MDISQLKSIDDNQRKVIKIQKKDINEQPLIPAGNTKNGTKTANTNLPILPPAVPTKSMPVSSYKLKIQPSNPNNNVGPSQPIISESKKTYENQFMMENHIIQLKIFFEDLIDEISVSNEPLQKKNVITTEDLLKKHPIAEDQGKFEKNRKILSEQIANARDLIINSGVTRKVATLFNQEGKEWPSCSTAYCLVDCHSFTTAPVGIPEKVEGNVFYLSGNFCSYNCAKKYLCPDDTYDDKFLQITDADRIYGDELSNKVQLLELLCHLETGMPITEKIRKAGSRLSLKIFGGYLSIDKYREGFHMHNEYHVYKTPLIPIVYQIEEVSSTNNNININNTTLLNQKKIETAYKNKMDQKKTSMQNIAKKFKGVK